MTKSWGEETGGHTNRVRAGLDLFRITSRRRHRPRFEMRLFFGGLWRHSTTSKACSPPAVRELGPLAYDEMYGFVPALALGDAPTLPHLQKVKAVEHLVILAQFAPLYLPEI